MAMDTNVSEDLAAVQLEMAGAVATLTLNRPDRVNAMNAGMDQQLRKQFEVASADANCRVIVITGAGKGFCSGADQEPVVAGATHAVPWNPLPPSVAEFRFGYLLESPKPVIAALNGAAIGVGLVLASYCDIRLAVDDAKLGFPYTRLGLVAEYGIAQVLPSLVGAGRARELLLTGRFFTGAQAMNMGLVSQTSARDGFDSMVRDCAASLALDCSPRSIGVIKRQLAHSTDHPFLEVVQQASHELADARLSSDYAEAKMARRERRKPLFTGT